jgi:hypothetical protein
MRYTAICTISEKNRFPRQSFSLSVEAREQTYYQPLPDFRACLGRAFVAATAAVRRPIV